MITLKATPRLGALEKNQFSDQYLTSVNRNTFDNIDYHSLFKNRLSSLFEQSKTLYIIIGTDSGLMIKEIIETLNKNDCAYIFIEFPEIIELTKFQYNINNKNNLIVTTEEVWEKNAKKIGIDYFFSKNNVKKIESFAAQSCFIDEYQFLNRAVNEQILHLSWHYQSLLGADVFIQRQLENLAENHTPALVLKDYYKGKTALILAGGPSIDDYIEWVEEYQEHFVVIAVSRIARRLLKTKIKPDIFISVDPEMLNFNVSKEILKFEHESLLVCQNYMISTLLGNWLGVNLYLGNLFPWETKENCENIAGIGPTVTNTAISLALKMGINRQIILGVDLCYSERGFSHASESLEHDSGPNVVLMEKKVTTNSGNLAETTHHYYEAIKVIELLSELARQSGGGIINPSPNSAKMKYVTHCKISDISIPVEKISIKKFLIQFKEQTLDSDYLISHYKNTLLELENAQSSVNKMINSLNTYLGYIQNLKEIDNVNSKKCLSIPLKQIEHLLSKKSLSGFIELSKKLTNNEAFYNSSSSNTELQDINIKTSDQTDYFQLRKGLVKLKNLIIESRNRVEVRLLEHDALTVDDSTIERHLFSLENKCLFKKLKNDRQLIEEEISNLKKTYNKDIIQNFIFYIVFLQHAVDRHAKRIFILEKNTPDFFTLQDDLNIIHKKTVKTYKDNLKKGCTDLLSNIGLSNKLEELKLDGLENKLYNLFEKHDIKALNQAVINLQKYDISNNEGTSFLHLAKGYQFELSHKYEQAIEEYGLANNQKTIESALKRIALIALKQGNFDLACDTLIFLSNISPEYLTQLADLYSTTKRYKDALDTYATYLEYNPTDISILLKIGNIYEIQGVLDGAIFIYEEILKIEPGCAPAQKGLKQLKRK